MINIHARGNGSTLGIELKDFDKVKIEDDLKSVHRLDPLVAKILNVRNDFLLATVYIIIALWQTLVIWMPLYGKTERVSQRKPGSDDYKHLLDGFRKGFDLGEM